jgi:hypothetical protein
MNQVLRLAVEIINARVFSERKTQGYRIKNKEIYCAGYHLSVIGIFLDMINMSKLIRAL